MSKVQEDLLEVEEAFCPGSWTKASRKGSKYIRGKLKYLCPECGKHYTADPYMTLTKHGYKLQSGLAQSKGKTVECLCAQCKKKFESPDGWDYLCEKCRGKL